MDDIHRNHWIVSPEYAAATVFSQASTIPRLWVTEKICDWSNLPAVNHYRRTDSPQHALERLQVANSNILPPILCLGLDGLDEGVDSAEREQIVREVLHWFWREDEAVEREVRPPRATLVVTCRKAEDLLHKWLNLDISGFGYRGEHPRYVEIIDFSLDELLDAARRSLPDCYSRLASALRLEQFNANREPMLHQSRSTYEVGVDEEVLMTLMHPAMWGAFLLLEPEVQVSVLDNIPQAIRQLAYGFVRRFCYKAIIRGNSFRLSQDALLNILSNIATYSQEHGRIQQSIDDWIIPACNGYSITREEARQLRYEAISGGLIQTDDPVHWRWRHNLVWNYLVEINDV